MYYAHSAPSREDWEPLRVHLGAVACRAADYAGVFGSAAEGRAAGLLHDLGKYSDLFTQRLAGQVSGLDHWSLGAWAALTELGETGLAVALAIQGHHVGLQKGDALSLRALSPRSLGERHPLGLRLTESDPKLLLQRLAADGLILPALAGSIFSRQALRGAGMLDIRMLFSALVDADFLETEAHFQAEEPGGRRLREEGQGLRPAEALARLEEHMETLGRSARAAPEVLSLRADLLAACVAAADLRPGLFTLSAPTGSGKTLAMLAFALRHAQKHGLRRIVLAIPYLSILEQTARVYRDLLEPVFGAGYILEHHSLSGTRGGDRPGGAGESDDVATSRRRARQLTENWDAPLILTTNVQLLESLFANRPGACRKLHRLAGSLLLFDEVQTLPAWLAVPTLAALSRLAERFGASVVFSTATQPAFEHLDTRVKGLAANGWAPREVVPESLGLFDRARRTRETWEVDRPLSWSALADDLAGHEQVLAIVNLKRHAADLTRTLSERGVPDLFHLSTNLCPAHREQVLAEVRRRLDPGDSRPPKPCRLLATQCVEAGVDLDFPFVYRALGPLEAIAQAAGRCNRNGRLPGRGEVKIFLPDDEKYPPGGYAQAAGATRALLKERGAEAMDLQSPELFRTYYRMLYRLTGIDADEQKGPARELREAIEALDFAATAGLYRLIDQDAINVLVPYDLAAFTALREELRDAGRLTTDWVRRARPHSVSLYRPGRNAPVWAFLDPAPLGRGASGRPEGSEDWFVYLEPSHYDRDLGLLQADELLIG